MRVRAAILGLVLTGCVAPVRVVEVSDLAGSWRGRIAGPRGNAPAQLTIDADGAYLGTMFLDAGDRPFRGRLVVVRPGELRYQGSEGGGVARLYQEDDRPVLRWRGDDDGAQAVFTR